MRICRECIPSDFLLLWLTVPIYVHHINLHTKSSTYHKLLICCLHQYKCQLCLLHGLGSNYTGELHQPNSVEDQLLLPLDLLYVSYDEDLLYASYDEDLLYASCDERIYYTPVVMRGSIIRQLCVGRIKQTNS